MNSPSKWIAVLIVIVAILALGWTQSSRNTEINQWEYMSHHVYSNGPSDQQMNKFGAEGWELVAIQSPSEQSPSIYIFKRRK